MDIEKLFKEFVEKEWHDGHEPQGGYDHYDEDEEVEEDYDKNQLLRVQHDERLIAEAVNKSTFADPLSNITVWCCLSLTICFKVSTVAGYAVPFSVSSTSSCAGSIARSPCFDLGTLKCLIAACFASYKLSISPFFGLISNFSLL